MGSRAFKRTFKGDHQGLVMIFVVCEHSFKTQKKQYLDVKEVGSGGYRLFDVSLFTLVNNTMGLDRDVDITTT